VRLQKDQKKNEIHLPKDQLFKVHIFYNLERMIFLNIYELEDLDQNMFLKYEELSFYPVNKNENY
jgi:hypothetical protein